MSDTNSKDEQAAPDRWESRSGGRCKVCRRDAEVNEHHICKHCWEEGQRYTERVRRAKEEGGPMDAYTAPPWACREGYASWEKPDPEELTALKQEVHDLESSGLLGPVVRGNGNNRRCPAPDAAHEALSRLRELLDKPNEELADSYCEAFDAMRTVLQLVDGRGHRLDAVIEREYEIEEVRDLRRGGLGALSGSTFAGWEDGHDGQEQLSPIDDSSGEVYEVQND